MNDKNNRTNHFLHLYVTHNNLQPHLSPALLRTWNLCFLEMKLNGKTYTDY